MTRVDLITLQQIRGTEPADKMQTKHAQQERVYRNTEPRDGFVDDGLVPIDKWGPPTEGGSTLPEPATDAEPFGYWVKYKWAEGQFVRMPAYIAPDGPNNKSTPLYTRPTPDHADAGKVEGGGWLPIERAPKDGTEILGWHKVAGPSQTRFYDGEWCCVDWNEDHYISCTWKPTHWRPLPTAPTSEVGK